LLPYVRFERETTMASTKTVYKVNEIARELRVDPTTVRRWCSNGTLRQGVDFFLLPHTGERVAYRFTFEQRNRLMSSSTMLQNA